MARRFILCLLLALATGCQQTPRATTTGATEGIAVSGIDVTRVRSDLYDFADEFGATVAGTTAQIAAATSERRIREAAIRWRIRTIGAIDEAIFEQEDPRRAYLEALAVCVKIRTYLEGERGAALFGDQVELARESARELETSLVVIGHRHMTAERVDSVRAAIEEIAEQQPLRDPTGVARLRLDQLPEGQRRTVVEQLLGVPLAPVRGLEGVGSTPEAVNRVARVVSATTEVLDRIPERTRWQIELLLLELESLPTIVELRAELQRISTTFETLTEIARTLPADVREELMAAIEASEEAQGSMRDTLRELQQASASVGETVQRADAAAVTIREATATLRDAAVAWESTAAASERVLAAVRELQGDPDAPPAEDGGFDFEQLAQAADRIGAAATEVRGLLDDLNAPLGETSGLAQALVSADEKTTGAITRASAGLDDAIDRLFWRGLLLVLIAFVLAGVYRVIFKRRS